MFLLYPVIILGITLFYIFPHVKEFVRTRLLLTKFPGPQGPLLLGNFLDFIVVDYASGYKQLRAWAKQYGPVYTLSICEYIAIHVASAEEFEQVAGGMKNIEKSIIYTLVHNWLGNGLLTSTGSTWQDRRKILTPAFHFNSLQEFVKVFNEESEQFIDALKKIDLDCVNIVPLVSNFTLKAVAEAAMNTKLDTSKKDDMNFIKATHKMGKMLFDRIMRPWLYNRCIYYHITSQGRQERKFYTLLHTFCNRIIRNKMEVSNKENENTGRKKLTMLDILLKAKDDDRIDEQGIRDEVNTFMFEGHDTTAMSICFTLMLLAYHKDVQELVYEEILQVVGKDDKFITITELNDLKYMERCIKESLRIYPSVPTISRKLEEDIKTRQGYVMPKGNTVFLDIIDIHRNPEYWPNPEKFDPDRFLPENCVNRHPFAYVPFSAGPRNCIGQKFAMLEQKSFLCKILQNFKLEAIDSPETIVLIQDLVLRPNNEILNIKFLSRH